MITIRRAEERGHFDHGWLNTYHTFSFGDYYDPAHMGFAALRVINEDRVQPGKGFGTHSHQDMEIVTYVLEGALEHRDSTGTHSVIRPGDVQRMSAGTGVTHSEFNSSSIELVHFLQIWIMPRVRGLAPSYEQREFREQQRRNRLCLIASSDGQNGSVTVHQDVCIFATLLNRGSEVMHPLTAGGRAWVQVARGSLRLNGQRMLAGDGAGVINEPTLTLVGEEDGEALLFDLA